MGPIRKALLIAVLFTLGAIVVFSALAVVLELLGERSREAERARLQQMIPPPTDRRIQGGYLFLDSGLCVDGNTPPRPWTRAPDDREQVPYEAVTFSAPLSAFNLQPQRFLNRDGTTRVLLTEIQVRLGPQPHSEAAWPITKPTLIGKHIESELFTKDLRWSKDRKDGLRLFYMLGKRDNWMIISKDPRTQCDTGFGMISLMPYFKCLVIEPASGAAGYFDGFNPTVDDVATRVVAVQALVRSVVAECPQRPRFLDR